MAVYQLTSNRWSMMLRDPSLQSKRVLVTAAGSGIGFTVAQGFLEAGADVYISDIDEVALRKALSRLPGASGCVCDVSLESQVAAMFNGVDGALGGLDVLVNNAGVAGPTSGVEDLSGSEFERTLAINVLGHVFCTKHAVKRLRAGRSPSIMNVSSVAGHLGLPGRSPYVASKWAVVGLTKTWAIELAQDGIRVNVVLPGTVDGPRLRGVIAAKAELVGRSVEEMTETYQGLSMLRRFLSPEDIANTVLFTASDLAGNVTRQVLAVDGFVQALA